MASTNAIVHRELTIKDRKNLTLNGVINVEEFTDSFMTLKTSEGLIFVEGSELKIESLTKEDGSLLVSGNISGVFYKTKSEKKSWFSRLFR